MSGNLVAACNALDALANAIRDNWSGEQTFLEAWGWNCPPLTRHDLSEEVRRLSNRLRELSPKEVDADLEAKLAIVPQRVSQFQNTTLQYFYNGNMAGSYPVYLSLMEWLRGILAPYLLPEVDWQDIEDQKLLPRALLRRLRSVDTQIQAITARSGDLDEKVATIVEAHAAAEALPTDLASLNEARAVVEKALAKAAAGTQRASEAETQATQILGNIKQFAFEAEKLVENCEDAYSAATTKGLGEAFAKRADSLTRSMWVWVVGLLVALALGAYLGSARVDLLRSLLASGNPRLGLIWINIALAFFSIAAPVWFAWIATKQIGQRFRLAEDYAYKASVAQAYEGYRREAARLDPQFAARLFGSALSRIEEAPLRFVEHESHGSPWHEALSKRFPRRTQVAAPEPANEQIAAA
ncbi:hypothetical protein [Sphingomonas sp.]|jgi:hypothetical protein|uniref:hypothetical protein n=1 Tax=Sphingomonas sp. TaxID=28214 RepID=UPI002DF295CC|nr:hypothetical protein [Sphingomonas sp.]